MKPVVDRLSKEYAGTIEFVVYPDVNSRDDIRQFAGAQRVSAVPTMVLVSAEGTELRRLVGSLPEEDLRRVLDSAK
ncbi:MAG: thioredoxin family protein [Coriobacteriia bacterium]|nr:thioredoxin family protein [Coriobacteriia bacterium]